MKGTGLKKETAAAIATLFGPTLVIPILFLLIEKDEYVRFWAMQSVVTFGILEVSYGVVAFIPIFGSLIFLLIVVAVLAYTYKSWLGDRWEVPVVSRISSQLLKKVDSR